MREQKKTIQKALFTGLGNTLDSEAAFEGQVCKRLSNELVFFVESTYVHGISLYLLKISCDDGSDKVATFELVATVLGLGMRMRMRTYGVESDPLEIDHVLTTSYYCDFPHHGTVDQQIANPKTCHCLGVLISSYNDIFGTGSA